MSYAAAARESSAPTAGHRAAERGRPPLARHQYLLHLLSASLAVTLWGVSYAVIRVAVHEIPPLTLASLRFVLAAAVLWPAARRRCRGERLAPEDHWTTFGLGFLGVTLYFAFENWGLYFTTASHGSLIIATIPLATALVEAIQRRTLPSAWLLGGLATALVGIGLTVGSSGREATVLGDLLVLGAVFSWVGYTFLARHLSDRYSPLFITQSALVVGAVTLAPLAALELLHHPIRRIPSPLAWASVAYLGVFCSALCYLLWNAAIPVLGVTVSSNLLNATPLVGVLTGVVALGEPFTATAALGSALILGGVVVASRPPAAPREADLAEEFR